MADRQIESRKGGLIFFGLKPLFLLKANLFYCVSVSVYLCVLRCSVGVITLKVFLCGFKKRWLSKVGKTTDGFKCGVCLSEVLVLLML